MKNQEQINYHIKRCEELNAKHGKMLINPYGLASLHWKQVKEYGYGYYDVHEEPVVDENGGSIGFKNLKNVFSDLGRERSIEFTMDVLSIPDKELATKIVDEELR